MKGEAVVPDPVSTPVGQAVITALADDSCGLVFPTQASANSWASAIARRGGAGVVDKDRFISWDSFLDLCRNPVEKPADADLRLIWAYSVLERSIGGASGAEAGGRAGSGGAEAGGRAGSGGFGEGGGRLLSFKRLISAGLKPSGALTESLSALAPDLPRLASALSRLPGSHPDRAGGLLEDYRLLESDYSRFLARLGLVEASWIPPRLPPRGRWLGFCPEFFSGFDRWKDELLSQGRFTVLNAGSLLSGIGFSVSRHSSSQAELDSAFLRLANLIDEGVHPEDLAILVPRLDPLTQAYIGACSRRFGLSVAFRSGQRLIDSPFGRILSALSKGEAEGWSLSSLRSLASPGAFRWKDAETAAALIRFGQKYHLPEISQDPQGNPRLWEASLRLCSKGDQAPGDFFQRLRASTRRLSSARDFSALRRSLYDFRSEFLDEIDLEPQAARTLERVFAELDSLEAWEGTLGSAMPESPRLGMLLSALGGSSYTPKPQGAALPVYPFRIGILLASSFSFVLDLSLDSTAEAKRHLTRMPADLAESLGQGENEGWNEELFIRSLAGARTEYCHATKGLGGYSLPHPFLLSERSLPEVQGGAALPPEELEAAAWRQARPQDLPERLTLRSKRAFLSGPGAGRRSAGKPSPDAAPLIPKPKKLSHKALRSFFLCPMKWFLESLPGMDGSAGDPAPLAEGSLTHGLIGELLTALAKPGGGESLGPGASHAALPLAHTLFRPSLLRTIATYGPALEPILEAAEPRILDRLSRLVEAEAEFEAEGWDLGEFEAPLSWYREDIELTIDGRADRIAQGRDGSFALVDYKKNQTPSASQTRVDAEGNLADFQLALYALILSASGRRPGAALYWSVESGKTQYLFGSGKERPDWDSFAPERDAVESVIQSVVADLEGGRALEARPGEALCSKCAFKPICRAHFATEGR